ncbi:MAG: DUF4256 domain-containing protein [Saprospiraceae bacterium]
MKSKISTDQIDALLQTLEKRFQKYPNRHKGMSWNNVLSKLMSNTEKINTLHEMENTGGEPDVVGYDDVSGEYIIYDCSEESPKGRRSLCYDDQALDDRKENKPDGSAKGMAASMGVQLLTEEQYRELQKLGKFDMKTSSWLDTPKAIRKLGGAIFGDCHYDHVFKYHNGAQSYYAARGFRGSLRV